MAAPKSGRHSRKRRKPARPPRAQTTDGNGQPVATTTEPDAAPAPAERAPRSAREALRPEPLPRRKGTQSERVVAAERARQRQRDTMLGTYGERPESPFGGLPISELAILVGAVGTVYGFFAGAPAALAVGVIVVTLGVAEFSAREHFSGYRSHTVMLAAIPAIGIGIALIALLGGSLSRGPLLLVVIPVFAVSFWFLRKRFRVARQARIARPPAP
jgi:uncharacterized protein GlcG (DUF336 family)